MLNENFFIKTWYKGSPLAYLFLPLTWLFCVVRFFRKKSYDFGMVKKYKAKVPVIIVGNISVGGTGKTPLIIALANKLIEMGFKPGIISRGYGGKSPVWPLSVTEKSNPLIVGDEPVMIAKQVACPMVVGPERNEDCETLLHRHPDCNVILSDDGLQHYALDRDYEIVVIDGMRKMGNGHCLPTGPLREPISRLKSANEVVVNGAEYEGATRMNFAFVDLYDIDDHTRTSKLTDFKDKKAHAVAAIGNPESFFNVLRQAGIEVIEHIFDDHYEIEDTDVKFDEDYPIIVTEKDAVKLELYHPHDIWVLPLTIEINDEFYQRVFYKLQELIPDSGPEKSDNSVAPEK